MGRLTDVQLQALVRKGQVVAGKSDGDGLTFTISKSGTAAWELRYRYGGKQRWLTLGRYPDMSLKEARMRALKERVRVADGVDVVAKQAPRQDRPGERQDLRRTLRGLHAQGRVSAEAIDPEEVQRYLDKDILPSLGPYRIEEVTAAEVVALIDKIGRRSASVARGTFSILSIVFKHGLAKHLAKSNPWSFRRLARLPMRTVRQVARSVIVPGSGTAVMDAVGMVSVLTTRSWITSCPAPFSSESVSGKAGRRDLYPE